MHPQVSKSAMKMELKLYGHTTKEAFIAFDQVEVSNSVASVGSSVDPVQMKTNSELQEKLRIPIKVTLENGKVTSYTLDGEESIESKKIKRTILRHLEVRLDKKALQSTGQLSLPLTYNHTVPTSVGNYSSHYIITSSPNPDFPKEKNVINITRTDNYEVVPYLAYHIHHNFEQQGCPGVCKKDHVENRFSAGCPAEFEPYHTPMKKSFVQHHNLIKYKDSVIISIVQTTETHVADIYDQNMEVAINSLIRYKDVSETPITEPTGQPTQPDLDDWSEETNEKELDDHCKIVRAQDAIPTVKKMLKEITQIVLKSSIDGDSKDIGEKLVFLQKALSVMRRKDLEVIQKDIVPYESIKHATEEEKIKRQIWLDTLPLIGSSESVTYIVDLIKNNINKKHNAFISFWECKSILEDLPMNIFKPDDKTIQSLSELLEALTDRTKPGFGMYYSAAHMAVARVIRNICAVSNGIEVEVDNKPNYLQMLLKETDDDYKNIGCPKTDVKRFIMDVTQKLKGNTDRLKRIIYIDSLTQTGLKSVIPIVKPYVQGYSISGETPSYVDFVRSAAINALHNLVDKHSKEIKDIVLPIYTNKTEPPKIRTAAFGVFARSYPTLGDLQHVAEETWHEPSIEVGSYVTSTLETLGNSSIPCDQLTASRIKKVLPRIKRFAVGKHHAQNVLTTIFDDIRGFGIEHVLEYTPSNESFIPSTIYAALGYNADSLRDFYYKYAINSQGFNSFNIWDKVLEVFSLHPAESIPKQKESDIFPQVKMADRATEFWRFTIFQKLFYSMSYYYMDDMEYPRGDLLDLLKDHIKQFLTWERGTIHGHIVKVWMPSTFQSRSFVRTLPYPVQFEMKNPMLLSLKLDIKQKNNGFSADIHPSLYHSMLYSNGMLNLGDCKHVGVYHETKIATTYPVKITVAVEEGKYHVSYSFPELPKKVFVYHSEAGTYTTKHNLEAQPTTTEKRVIRTIPSSFVRNSTFGVVGFPLFRSDILTEDISLGYEQVPRNIKEALDQTIEDFLNPGWRRKTVEISRIPDSIFWPPKTEVKMHITLQHEFIKSTSKSNFDFFKKFTIDEVSEKNITSEENLLKEEIKKLSHVYDSLTISVEQKVSDKDTNTAYLHVAHKRTLDGYYHHVHMNATAKVHGLPLGATSNFIAMYFDRPNELKYSEDHYGQQKGIIVGSIRLQDKPYVTAKVILKYKSLEEHLNKGLQKPLPSKYFYPETHEECLEDVKKGKVHSVACIKAIKEHAIYNRMKIHLFWGEDVQEIPILRDILHKVDIAIKHAFFNHLSVKRINSIIPNYINVDVTYIDKLTDKPVVDVVVRKPSEILKFYKVDPSFIQPISSIYSVPETYVQYHTNNTYPATCTLMKNSVRTYDLKTIHLVRRETCSYILSTHCVRHKKFAVIVKIDPRHPESKEVHLHIGTHSVVLTPGKEWEYEIQYDDKPQTIQYLSEVMLHETEKIYAVVKKPMDGHAFIEIHGEKAGIKVTYDGEHVKIQVHPRYKGELCGLCSEFDGEIVRELRGPDRCLYSNIYDYGNSCALGNCYKSKPEHPHICDTPIYRRMPSEDIDEISRQEEYEPKVKRNKVLPKDDKLCFSTRPLPACESQDVIKVKESKEVEFHCLPKSDRLARKLVSESKRRILGELETKEVDVILKVDYPKLCAIQ
ncbi:uncharacterized protein LOC129963676 [Argiope bruennichi]|uniref:uncharacterized protein LOC129963676 n=1 Tax=Argiope bruennichi TaxID=94029 RepID=UPI0024950637|nr:uncharacterized protein LOC129963676 [Argiope bruennichi]